MNEVELYERMSAIEDLPEPTLFFDEGSQRSQKIAEHKAWLQTIRRERPSPAVPFKVGIYIRYFNQTRYDNYLSYHKKQFENTVGLCPLWELVDFYIDEGSTAPNMETAPEWSRLLEDCMSGKVNLIITQKVSNVSKKMYEVTFCARMLATQPNPVGIYFISEDIFTLASYYQDDLRDPFFMPEGLEQIENTNIGGLLHD